MKPTCPSSRFTSCYRFAASSKSWPGRMAGARIPKTLCLAAVDLLLPYSLPLLVKGGEEENGVGQSHAVTCLRFESKPPDTENSVSLPVPCLCPLNGVHSECNLTSPRFYLTWWDVCRWSHRFSSLLAHVGLLGVLSDYLWALIHGSRIYLFSRHLAVWLAHLHFAHIFGGLYYSQ